MKLSEKIRSLREAEGTLRGLNRSMTQLELLKALEAETGKSMSQSYLSQIESGARPHLTHTTRQHLATFFKVHPGYLVDDPEGYHADLPLNIRQAEDRVDLWLAGGAERFRKDPELRQALLKLARHKRSRDCLLVLETILDTPDLMDRLCEMLAPPKKSVATKSARKG